MPPSRPMFVSSPFSRSPRNVLSDCSVAPPSFSLLPPPDAHRGPWVLIITPSPGHPLSSTSPPRRGRGTVRGGGGLRPLHPRNHPLLHRTQGSILIRASLAPAHTPDEVGVGLIEGVHDADVEEHGPRDGRIVRIRRRRQKDGRLDDGGKGMERRQIRICPLRQRPMV